MIATPLFGLLVDKVGKRSLFMACWFIPADAGLT